ncbi:MAG: hypothetical protein MK078_15050 [Crocinitomicaceae bacterium]|nr:hypothetical protein [Crocinitomicaceae bacterium]
MSDLLWVILISAVSATIFAFVLQKKGYGFWRYFVTIFIATAGIAGILFKLLKPYF